MGGFKGRFGVLGLVISNYLIKNLSVFLSTVRNFGC